MRDRAIRHSAPRQLTQQNAVFDSVVRSSFDQILEPNATNADFPPSPKWFSGNTRRMNEGNYTWLATVVSDPTGRDDRRRDRLGRRVLQERDSSPEPPAKATVRYVSSFDPFPVFDHRLAGILRPYGRQRQTKAAQAGPVAHARRERDAPRGPRVGQYNEYRWYKVIAAATPESPRAAPLQAANHARRVRLECFRTQVPGPGSSTTL